MCNMCCMHVWKCMLRRMCSQLHVCPLASLASSPPAGWPWPGWAGPCEKAAAAAAAASACSLEPCSRAQRQVQHTCQVDTQSVMTSVSCTGMSVFRRAVGWGNLCATPDVDGGLRLWVQSLACWNPRLPEGLPESEQKCPNRLCAGARGCVGCWCRSVYLAGDCDHGHLWRRCPSVQL